MLTKNNEKDHQETLQRQYRLIRYITLELMLVCVLATTAYAFKGLWYLVGVINLAAFVSLINLAVLNSPKYQNLSGHVLVLVTLLTITTTNYLVWGIGPTYSYWFYVIPLLAASVVGWVGTLVYSLLALFMIVSSSLILIPPFYELPPRLLLIIEWANHLFAYIIIVTTVINLMLENKYYEQVLHDKNQLLEAEKDKYQYLARFDQLTNLPNRQYFKHYLHEQIQECAPNYAVTVFFMDLDNLKYINDTHGHDLGDHLLLQTARRLQSCFREGDFVARLGGDEFTAIVTHEQDQNILETISQRIIEAFSRPFIIGDGEYECSISIGLATSTTKTQSEEELMINADKAMYAAKKIKGSAYSFSPV